MFFSQIITTFAGNGIAGYTGDGILATNAEVAHPVGLNFDNNGNLMLCQDNSVRKINHMTNIISTIAGNDTTTLSGDGGPATMASVISPYAVCVDASGNIYIDDYQESCIRRVDITTGVIQKYAGNGTPTYSGDGGLAINAELEGPSCVCIDTGLKMMYISDEWNFRVRKVDMTTGIISTVAGTGTNGYSGDGILATDAEISRPIGLCLDHTGNIYIGDWDNGRIRKVDIDTGIISTYAGNGTVGYFGDGDPATDGMFNKPVALIFDPCGNLCFADQFNNRIRRIDAVSGMINTIAGNGIAGFSGDNDTATNAELYYPDGLCFESTGNFYVSDWFNHRIRKISYSSSAPSISIVSLSGDTLCSGSTITVVSTVTGTAATYQWYINGSLATGTGSSYSYTPADGDSVRCVLTYASACGSAVVSSNTVLLTVAATLTPTVSVTAPAYATTGSVVTVNATVAGAGSSYNLHWYNHHTYFATTTLPTVTYTKTLIRDSITASITSTSPGCYDSVLSGVAVVIDSTLGVANVLPTIGWDKLIYPNPAVGTVTVQSPVVMGRIEICDVLGHVVMAQTCSSNVAIVSVAGLPRGVYFVRVDGVMAGRFVKG